MARKLLSHVRHNVVAYIALFVAMGGTAIAAKPMLTGADVQDGTLNSADLRDRGSASYPGPSVQGTDLEANTLTGTEILESSLGQVPSASDADTLDGKDSSDFLPSAKLFNFSYALDPTEIAPHTCRVQTVFPSPQPASFSDGDPVFVSRKFASVGESDALMSEASPVLAGTSGLNFFILRLCNVREFAVDPPEITFKLMSVDTG